MQELIIRADQPIMYPEMDDQGRLVRFSHMPDSTEFSISRAVRAMVSRDTRAASAEFEYSSAISKRVGKLPAPHGFYAPASALFRMIKTTSPAYGSNLIPTEHLGDLYAHVLREQSLVGRLGIRTLPSDGGDLAIPKSNASTPNQQICPLSDCLLDGGDYNPVCAELTSAMRLGKRMIASLHRNIFRLVWHPMIFDFTVKPSETINASGLDRRGFYTLIGK